MITIRRYTLDDLKSWLNVELPGTVLFGLSYFYNIAFYLFLLAALLFTPLMIYVLLIEKRFGWLLSFALVVVLPSAALFFGPVSGGRPA